MYVDIMPQRIMWNDKKALLIDFADTDRNGEKNLRNILSEPNDIEVLVFKVSNIIFIPKDLRDMLTYSKMVHVAILPKAFKVIPSDYEICPDCGGTGRKPSFKNEDGSDIPSVYYDCERCNGTGKVPPSKMEMKE